MKKRIARVLIVPVVLMLAYLMGRILVASSERSKLREMARNGYEAFLFSEELPPAQMHAGEGIECEVTPKNLGSTAWIGHGEKHYVALGIFRQTCPDRFWGRAGHGNLPAFRMLKPDGAAEGEANRIIAPAEPGIEPAQYLRRSGQWSVKFHLVAPSRPGLYHLRLQMVQEGIGWFGDTLKFDVEVVP